MKRSFLSVVAVCATSLVVTTSAHSAAATSSPSDRAAVLASYAAEFERFEPLAEWDGSVGSCIPGTTSAAYKQSVLRRVNWYREFVGLSPVAYAVASDTAVQAAALNMAANQRLSHAPQAASKCYSSLAYEGASTSNIAGGVAGISAINAYIDDAGASNTAVGHRAWIFSPTLGSVATGDVPTGAYASNALMVVTDPVAPATPRDGFIAWPPPGYFPSGIFSQRWSFATPYGLNNSGVFENATVSVTGPGGPVAASIVDRNQKVVFEPAITASVAQDTSYRVTIANLASTPSTYSYTVTLTPTAAPRRAPSVTPHTPSSCATADSAAAWLFYASDIDVTLPGGYADNDLFSVQQNSVITNKQPLDPSRSSYSVRVLFTLSTGSSMYRDHTITTAEDASLPCPVTALSITPSGTSVNLSWAAPSAGAPVSKYSVILLSTGAGCSTTALSCTLKNLTANTVYQGIVVTHATNGSQISRKFSFTAGSSSSTTPSVPAPLRTKVKYRLAKLMKLPAGAKKYRVAGVCKLSKDNSTVSARTPGTCTIRVTTRSKSTRTTLTFRSAVPRGT